MDALLLFVTFFDKIFEIDQFDIVCNIGIHIRMDVDDVHKRQIKSLRISSSSDRSSLFPYR